MRLPVWQWILVWLAVVVGGAAAAHYAVHGVVNGWHLAVSLFLAINILICIWEISLGAQITNIERWHHDPAARAERPRGLLWTQRVSPGELASTKLWARVWSEYARYDDGYADRKSFGFSIDVGNGWSSLLPSVFFLVGMTAGYASPVVLGLVGALLFYQKLYCTVLYFFQYLFNRRYEGHSLASVLAVVGGSNGIWIVFPAVGLYVCVRLVLENRFDLIWS
ncbi:MAG: hypothetical protein ACR2PQ_11490 [Myxococcota bacterium]